MEASRHNNGWIVAGINGSDEADRGLQWAVDEAQLRGAGVRIVTAWRVPLAAIAAHGASPPSGVSLEEEIRRTAEAVADAAAKKVRERTDVPVETHVIEGKPAEVLIEHSRGAALLVLGSQPEGAFMGRVMNSVTVQCALHAPAPMAIIR